MDSEKTIFSDLGDRLIIIPISWCQLTIGLLHTVIYIYCTGCTVIGNMHIWALYLENEDIFDMDIFGNTKKCCNIEMEIIGNRRNSATC